MIFLKYILSFFLAIVSASFISIILTTLRCGIPICKKSLNGTVKDVPQEELNAIKKLLKKYYLSLLIDSVVIVLLSLIVVFPLKETLIFYIIIIVFYTLISFNKTGMTQDNLMEVDNSIIANKAISSPTKQYANLDEYISNRFKSNGTKTSFKDLRTDAKEDK